MTLLDAYALVALLTDEPAAEEVEDLLRRQPCAVVIANLAEAVDSSQRIHGLSAGEIRSALEPLLVTASISAVVSEQRDAWLAGDLRARHYNRRTRALSLADCFLLACALIADEAIATADPPLADAGRAEGIEVVALPDSGGVRP